MPARDNLLVAIGVKAKPQARPGMPPSLQGRDTAPATPESPVQPQTGAKASPEDACFVTADQRCGDCANWERETQSCSKVEGSMSSGAGCAKYFEPMGGGMGEGSGVDDLGGEANAPLV